MEALAGTARKRVARRCRSAPVEVREIKMEIG
jgi:hypothetical protein